MILYYIIKFYCSVIADDGVWKSPKAPNINKDGVF